MRSRDDVPVEFSRWVDLTDRREDANSADAILRGQELYEAWALRADLDGVCVLCAIRPSAEGSQYCAAHTGTTDPHLT